MAIVNYDFLLFLLTGYDFSVHTKKRFVIALNKRTFTNTGFYCWLHLAAIVGSSTMIITNTYNECEITLDLQLIGTL
jgi:hypothetical protein